MEPTKEPERSMKLLFLLRNSTIRDEVKQMIKDEGIEAVRRSIQDFLREMIAEYGKE